MGGIAGNQHVANIPDDCDYDIDGCSGAKKPWDDPHGRPPVKSALRITDQEIVS